MVSLIAFFHIMLIYSIWYWIGKKWDLMSIKFKMFCCGFFLTSLYIILISFWYDDFISIKIDFIFSKIF